MNLVTEHLLTALNTVKAVARARSVGENTGLIRIEASMGLLYITASCLGETVIWMCRKIQATGDLQPTCVRFDYLLNALGDTESTEIKQAVEGKMLTITSGTRVSRLSCLSVDQFPSLPDLSSMKSVAIGSADLRDGIFAVSGFEHDKMERAALTTIHIIATPKQLMCETSNGLNAVKFIRPMLCPEFEIMIPGKCAPPIMAALAESESILAYSDGAVAVNHANGWVWCALLADLKYPGTDGFYNAPDTEWYGKVDTLKLKVELERALPYFDPAKAPAITLNLKSDGMHMQLAGLDCDVSFSCAGEFKEASMRANCGSLIKCLVQIKSAKCKLGGSERVIFLSTDEITVVSGKMRDE